LGRGGKIPPYCLLLGLLRKISMGVSQLDYYQLTPRVGQHVNVSMYAWGWGSCMYVHAVGTRIDRSTRHHVLLGVPRGEGGKANSSRGEWSSFT